MANDEFEMYFQRAKIEEDWLRQDMGAPPGRARRCSLPVLSFTSDTSSSPLNGGRYRRQSVKNSRKKSIPYSSHNFQFPSTIPEVTSPDVDDSQYVADFSQSEPMRRKSLTPLSSNDQPEVEEEDDNSDDVSETESEHEESFPNKNDATNSDEIEEVLFIRDFRTSSKGVENRLNSVKRTRRSSTATCSFEHSGGRKKGLWLAPELSALDFAEVALRASSLKNCEITRSVSNILRNSYKVLILGDKQVGKTALTRQLMTSHCLGALDSPQDCATMTSISVTLDGEETVIELEEQRPPKDLSEGVDAASAYIVLFAVDSASSFTTAKDVIETCKEQHGKKAALLMVANKTDLVRRRAVSCHDAKNACRRLGCKFIEVSVTLGHNVDNLLVGIVKQIHLNPKRQTSEPPTADTDNVPKSPKSKSPKTKAVNCFPIPRVFTKKLSLKYVSQSSSDCENLSVL